MEGELIFMAFVMLIGQIILLQMWNNQWFKKENFKMEKSNVMATNKLNLRKLEKEMGLSKSKDIIQKDSPGLMSTISDLAPLLKGLDADQIGALADKFLGGGEVDAGGEGVSDLLMDFATKNPEMVKEFLGGLTGEKKGEQSQSQI